MTSFLIVFMIFMIYFSSEFQSLWFSQIILDHHKVSRRFFSSWFCSWSRRQVFECRGHVFSDRVHIHSFCTLKISSGPEMVHATHKKNMPVSIGHKLNTGIYKPFGVHGALNQRPSSQKPNLTISKWGHILMLIPVIVQALLPWAGRRWFRVTVLL